MIATYNNHVIETLRGAEGWTTLIDRKPSGIRPAKRRGWAIKWAMQHIDDKTSWRDVLNDIIDRQQAFFDGLEKS